MRILLCTQQYGMSDNSGIWQPTFPNCSRTLTCGERFRKQKVCSWCYPKKIVCPCHVASFPFLSQFLRLKTRLPIATQEQAPDSRLHDFIIHWFTHPFIFFPIIFLSTHLFLQRASLESRFRGHSLRNPKAKKGSLACWFSESLLPCYIG